MIDIQICWPIKYKSNWQWPIAFHNTVQYTQLEFNAKRLTQT